jgi:hypothetical protein
MNFKDGDIIRFYSKKELLKTDKWEIMSDGSLLNRKDKCNLPIKFLNARFKVIKIYSDFFIATSLKTNIEASFNSDFFDKTNIIEIITKIKQLEFNF